MKPWWIGTKYSVQTIQPKVYVFRVIKFQLRQGKVRVFWVQASLPGIVGLGPAGLGPLRRNKAKWKRHRKYLPLSFPWDLTTTTSPFIGLPSSLKLTNIIQFYTFFYKFKSKNLFFVFVAWFVIKRQRSDRHIKNTGI